MVAAYLELKNLYPARVSLNLLWAMQGALLPDEMKAQLKAELAAQSNS